MCQLFQDNTKTPQILKFRFELFFLLIILGCKSKTNLNNREFTFSMESLNYPLRKAIYDSETDIYYYKINYEKEQIINMPFTNEEKDSLRKIFTTNFCQCIKSYNEDSKITYKRIHKLIYKSQKKITKCDTVLASSDLPKMNQFKYFTKFRKILTEKPEYQNAFPEEFVTY